MSDSTVTVFVMIVLIGLLVIFGPILTIWALNTLFPQLAIPYTIGTWFAALVLGGVVRASKSK